MLLKSLLIGLLMLSGSAMASPETQERHQFCYATAATAYEVVEHKHRGMTKENFDKGLSDLIQALKDQGGVTGGTVDEVFFYLTEAYVSGVDPGAAAQSAYTACMNKKQV